MRSADWCALGLLLVCWLAYFALHSLLATTRCKQWVAARHPALMPYFRLAYNLFASVSLLPIVVLLLTDTGPDLWAWHGVWAWLANGLALAALFGFWSTLEHYDTQEFLGLRQWRSDVPQIMDREDFHLSPFHRHVRHPWYFCSLVLIWTRDMNAAMLLSAVLMTLYFIAGSRLEEKKLLQSHGAVYRRYMQRVPGLIPWPGKSLSAQAAADLIADHDASSQ